MPSMPTIKSMQRLTVALLVDQQYLFAESLCAFLWDEPVNISVIKKIFVLCWLSLSHNTPSIHMSHVQVHVTCEWLSPF